MVDSLLTWNQGAVKEAIVEFVEAVCDENSPDYRPPVERIAVFDKDGTLWCEKPMYIQFDYFLRRLAEAAEADPELRGKYPWRAAWERDSSWFDGVITKHYLGDDADFRILIQGILGLAAGVSVEEVEKAARDFVSNTRHPKFGILYKDCTYQPMLELLRYLEDNAFTNYIVSGGGRDFMRGFSEELYNIPRERVIGSTVAYHCVETDDGIQIVQQPELDVIDDGPGKPLQIWSVTGRYPILAAGNANGDIQMLKMAQSSRRKHLNLLVHHDDDVREYAYTRGAEQALELASKHSWQVISMKSDWHEVFKAVGG